MTAEDHIIFVAELLNLINELQELVREHCQILTFHTLSLTNANISNLR